MNNNSSNVSNETNCVWCNKKSEKEFSKYLKDKKGQYQQYPFCCLRCAHEYQRYKGFIEVNSKGNTEAEERYLQEHDGETHLLHFLDIIVLILSVFVLLSLLVEYLFILPHEVKQVLIYADHFICLIFIIDWFRHLKEARSKWRFLRWGWIDLLASIPNISWFRVGRMVRVIRIIRILRAFRSMRYVSSHLFKNRTQATFATSLLIAGLVVIFGSIALLEVETESNSLIKTAGDALWYSVVTVATVGYGDKYPVTIEGKIIAVFLMITGVGLFGTFTGFVANWFMGKKE